MLRNSSLKMKLSVIFFYFKYFPTETKLKEIRDFWSTVIVRTYNFYLPLLIKIFSVFKLELCLNRVVFNMLKFIIKDIIKYAKSIYSEMFSILIIGWSEVTLCDQVRFELNRIFLSEYYQDYIIKRIYPANLNELPVKFHD